MPRRSKSDLLRELQDLRQRLDEAEQVVRGIQSGEVDALVVSGSAAGGEKIYTLEEANQPYRVMVEAMSEGALTLALDGTVLYSNVRFAEIIRKPLEEIIGHAAEEFVIPEQRKKLSAFFEHSSEADRVAEYSLQASDGSTGPAQFSVVPLSLSGTQVVCVVVTDLTAVNAVREARLCLAAIVESSDDAIISTGLDGTILNWNPGAERIYGYTAAEVVGKPYDVICPPEATEDHARTLERLRQGKLDQHFETVRVRKDGTKIDISVSMSLVKDADGQMIAVSRMHHDITERKRIQQAAEKQSMLAETFFNNSLLGMVIFDRNFNFVRVNKAYAQACRKNIQELIGRYVFDVYGPEAKPLFDEVMRTKLPFTAVAKPFTFSDQPERGATYWDWTLVPLLDPRDEVEYLVWCGNEVTERKQAEQEIQRLSAYLIQAQEEERGRIARELHDSTAQSLAAVAANLRVVQRLAIMDDRTRECLESAAGMVRQCLTEVRDMSQLLHPPALDELGLPATLTWFVDRFQRQTGLAVDLQVSRELGRLPKEAEMALFRIVQEGLTNVYRHSQSARATVELAFDHKRVLLRIVDEGKGSGARGSGRPRSGATGAGVGILRMREWVKQLDGEFEINFSSRGTAVRVSFPFARNC